MKTIIQTPPPRQPLRVGDLLGSGDYFVLTNEYILRGLSATVYRAISPRDADQVLPRNRRDDDALAYSLTDGGLTYLPLDATVIRLHPREPMSFTCDRD